MRICLDIDKGYKYLFFVVFIFLFLITNNTLVSEELDKDSRIKELERKLESVIQEVNKLKEESSITD